jgi:aminopeptidase
MTVLRPSFPETAEIFYEIADDAQLKHVHSSTVYDTEHTDVSLHVMAETNTQALSGVDPAKISAVRLARKILSEIRKERIRWNVTSFPTNAYAQDAGMSLTEFAEFVFSAAFLNAENPLETWRALRRRQRKMVDMLQGVKVFRLEAPDADLTMSLEGRRICESSGAVNMPDGEIYTAPVETDVNGWISFSFPGYFMGQVVEGIRLEFEKGIVVKAEAKTNEAFLLKMLDTDPGARRLGELGIGTNWGINRFTRNILFDEKMGGTIHLALGDAYREALGTNRSAIHWDILHDLRVEGRLYADGEVLLENGRFQGRFADLWCEDAPGDCMAGQV